MIRNPLPYPPQMRNGGLLPAHLPSSPHSNPVATIVSDLKFVAAIVSDLTSSLAAIPASAEKALAEEKRRQEVAAQENALADEANERRRHETAAQEKALAGEANERCRAAAHAKALADEANKQRRAAAQEKALADETNERCRAAAWDKALADEANERCPHESAECATTSVTKALAKDEHNEDDNNVAWRIEEYAAPFFTRVDTIMAEIRAKDDGFGNWAALGDELLVEEDDKASAPMMLPSAPPMAMLSPHHRPKSYVDAVLTTMGGSSQATSPTLAQAALPLPAVNGQLRMARQCAQPRRCVGRRHGPRAPNPQEHLLCGRQHRPRAPNQYTVNGWA
jgi:hypothetical protein